jgi:transcriptional repressor NrdR
VDKRNLEELDTIRRRRECLSCGQRFSTYERIEWTGVSVSKKDGRRESFDRNKLLAGLLKACEKRPIPREEVEKLVSTIEAELYNYGSREVPAQVIGELVMDRLKALDKVAYIRFASVYREFTDLKSFEKELRTLKKN